MDTNIMKRPIPLPYPDAAAPAAPVTAPALAHGNRDDFFLLANCRRLLGQTHARTQNWVIAMELFATGSSSAHEICRNAGIDPFGTKIPRLTGAAQ